MTNDAPRISMLPTAARCPGFMVLDRDSERSSSAAETGSAVGRVIELWHRLGEGGSAFEEAVRNAMAESAGYPTADWDLVREWALMYASDPRQRGVVLAEHCELEVRVVLPADADDPTGEPVELVGHVDQIRRGPVGLEVWDLKSGRPSGQEMTFSYALQIAAYALAATETLGVPVLPGGIVRLRGYDMGGSRSAPKRAEDCSVFYPMPWSLETCRSLIATAVYTVGELRRGIVRLQPGVHCAWCPGGGPGTCGPRVDLELARLAPAAPLPAGLEPAA